MRGPTSSKQCPSTCPGRDDMLQLHQGAAHRSRRAREYPRRRPIYRRLAWRQGRGAALQSDGGCGDGRDLPHPALAMAAVRAPLDDGRRLTRDLFEKCSARKGGLLAEVPNFAEAARLMRDMIVVAEPGRIPDFACVRAAGLNFLEQFASCDSLWLGCSGRDIKGFSSRWWMGEPKRLRR